MIRGADISECGAYRYALYREWDLRPSLVFIGLNPSTADAQVDDPTARRCIRFAKDNGHGGLIMVNLFAFRATKPSDLRAAEDPTGPRNNETLDAICNGPNKVVVAWGTTNTWSKHRREAEVTAGLRGPLWCLGKCADGSPRHPLYVKADTPFEIWREYWDV